MVSTETCFICIRHLDVGRFRATKPSPRGRSTTRQSARLLHRARQYSSGGHGGCDNVCRYGSPLLRNAQARSVAHQPAGFDAFTRRIYRRDWRRPLKLLLKNHSIISVTRTKNDSGMVKPSAFAVVLLKTRSNLRGCSTGMSAGFEPRRILSM